MTLQRLGPWITIGIALMLASVACAEDRTRTRVVVSGQVVLSDGTPASGAEVTLMAHGGSAIADRDGWFVIEAELPAETTDLSLTALLHVDDTQRIATMSGIAVADDGEADAGVLTLRSSCDPQWAEGLFCLNGLNGAVHTVMSWDDGSGEALYVGGSFTIAGCATVSNIARWDGAAWSPLGLGVNSTVYALTVFDDGTGSAIYVGGAFTQAGDSLANRIARWDGTAWSPLGAGLNTPAYALEVFDDGFGPNLYAGGSFTEAGGSPANRIARWDGSAWSSLGFGVNGEVRALTIFDDGTGPALYAGGLFNFSGESIAQRVARWDGTTWSPLGSGVNGEVRALANFDDGSGPALYAGGNFTQAGGSPANRIARWDGTAWSPLGVGVDAQVRSLAVVDDGSGPSLYVGGFFNSAGGSPASRIARWNGSVWSSLGAGVAGSVEAMTGFDDGSGPIFYAAGSFTQAGGKPASFIARWDSAVWIPLGTGLNDRVSVLAVFDDGSGPALYAGGRFTQAGESQANRIARWDGTAWSPLGLGITGANSEVFALSVFDDGSGPALYVGGDFTQAGGNPANRIARWDGAVWAPLGDGMNSWVRALAIFDDGTGPALYAGGRFNQAGGILASRIARWDGTTWSPLGAGIGDHSSSSVLALAVFDDGSGPALYAGGNFTQAGGSPANRIARWNGTTWSTLGAGLSGTSAFVQALAVFNDGSGPALYAGGNFTQAGGNSASRIARWDGTDWSSLGAGVNGLDSSVLTLTVFDDGSGPALYAGGSFTEAGTGLANRAARWDGTAWSTLGTGLENDDPDVSVVVADLIVFDNGFGPALYVGGDFTYAGGRPVSRMARWSSLCPLPPNCPADLTGPALDGVPDGTVNAFDLNYYIALWIAADPAADLTGPALDGTPDGTVNAFDLNYYLDLWLNSQGPCP